MYLILLHEDVAADPRTHAPIVAKHLGITLLEARMAVRRGRGIFLDDLTEPAAREIAESLEKAGVRASVAAKAELPPLPSPRKVARLERGEERFPYRIAGTEETGLLAWHSLGVVSCGLVARPARSEKLPLGGMPAIHRVDRPEDRDVLRANLLLRLERREPAPAKRDVSTFERIETAREFRVFLDLVTADLGAWLRVGMEEFGYVLTAGSVQMGGAWGLEALMKDLRLRAAPALTDLTLDILAAEDPAPYAFGQLEELNRYTLWTVLRRRLKLEPEIPWAERDESST